MGVDGKGAVALVVEYSAVAGQSRGTYGLAICAIQLTDRTEFGQNIKHDIGSVRIIYHQQTITRIDALALCLRTINLQIPPTSQRFPKDGKTSIVIATDVKPRRFETLHENLGIVVVQGNLDGLMAGLIDGLIDGLMGRSGSTRRHHDEQSAQDGL